MEDTIRNGRHDLNLASRKAEEAAWRRFEATQWLDSLVGPLGISTQPSEREFISCLGNGLVLCNAINKIQPGSIPKVVESNAPSQFLTWDSQPLPAYQYFENVRNFLVAVEELKLPTFEASDLERDNLEVGSSAKVVDCILALRGYHEWKQLSGGNGFFKPPRSPLVMHSANRVHSRASEAISSDPCRQLDMSKACNDIPLTESGTQKLEDLIAKAIVDCMIDGKENIDNNLIAPFRNGNLDPGKLFGNIMSTCLEEQLQNKFPEFKSIFKDLLGGGSSIAHPISPPTLKPLENLSIRNHKNLKELLSRTKREFKDLQSQLQSDLKHLGSQVQEMSTAALGYHKVVKENRNLYNMVQDLKGNIRVYCRIRPAFSAEARNVIDFIGEDGSLVVLDPLKPQKDGRKVFQFNHVFGQTATQDEIFKDTQPAIRSVMDGYNVCIFAYGQTGSGKTHTMCGSTRDQGINYLALNDLFRLSNRRKDIMKYDIHVQMVEIYNEQVRDLLAEDSANTKYPFAVAFLPLGTSIFCLSALKLLSFKLEIRSCTSENGLSIPDASMHYVESTNDVLSVMKRGDLHRVVSSTAINNQSSRSHSVLTVHVHGKDVSGSILRSCLHLVDLAGSERVEKSEVSGDGLKEAQYINKSLSCLGDVISALAQKSSHIPYRNSKLTLLLQNALGGHAKTLMFAHVSPEADSFGETISTLKFAQRVSTVELGVSHMNKESSEVMELKQQIESLQKALANKEARTVQPTKPKEPRSPFEKPPHAMTERTPPRSRRLSIENSNKTEMKRAINSVDKRGPKSPSMPTRSRRLSLEGSRTVPKDPVQIKLSETVSNLLPSEAVLVQKYTQFQDPEAATKPYGHVSNGESMINIYRQRAPRSPTLQPKTPEPPKLVRNEVHIMMHGESNFSTEPRTPGLTSNANGKGSHIRKSLRTIGKLINGSEKRNQQKKVEASPVNGMRKIHDASSPVSANASPLTGVVQTSDSRSSLGGTNEAKNSKTPPPVHISAKATNQWM
ncbi:hypothetical protein ACSBR2_034139 [Camellia fascicularis]